MSLSTEEAFLDHIATNREDALTKLVYADWLEEQGDALLMQKAHFLRKEAEYLKAEKHSDAALKASDELRKLAYSLPHEWCPKVVHPSFPSHILPDPKHSPGARRIVKTARTKDEINVAARSGLKPLVLPVTPNKQISSWVAVYQDPETGEIETTGDHRYPPSGTRVVNVRYYPYHFASPFAAYLVPADLQPGEEVWLEDVVEDIVGVWGNQGHTYRLESAPARWTGATFEILFNPQDDAPRWIG
jgi:uncharacterized protein (TIGR02996 family)